MALHRDFPESPYGEPSTYWSYDREVRMFEREGGWSCLSLNGGLGMSHSTRWTWPRYLNGTLDNKALGDTGLESVASRVWSVSTIAILIRGGYPCSPSECADASGNSERPVCVLRVDSVPQPSTQYAVVTSALPRSDYRTTEKTDSARRGSRAYAPTTSVCRRAPWACWWSQ
jgi:hypothetical protein